MKKIFPYLLVSILFAQESQQGTEASKPKNTSPKQTIEQPSNSNSQNSKLIQCNTIFEQRKSEIVSQIRELDDKKQSLDLLQKAADDLFNRRENKLKEKEQDLNNQLKSMQAKEESMKKDFNEREANIKKLIAKNEELIRTIQEESDNKIAQTYAKMKDSKAAAILNDLPNSQAAGILFLLKTQEMGKILAKMQPQKAAELTELLKKGPPFEDPKQKKPATENSNESKDEKKAPSSVPGDTDSPSSPLI